ncbi:MAG: EamA family transporter [Ignavibacteria bacterium]|jgi:drug/metabolite transporter (DMT)-like permease
MRDGRPLLTKTDNPPALKVALAFSAIYLVWGSTYLAIRYAVETIPPFAMGGVRFLVAGLILIAVNYFKGAKGPTKKDWKIATITGGLMFGGGNGAVIWVSQFMPSSLTAIVIATIPIWIILIHWMQSKDNKPDNLTIIGVIVGIAGVALLTEIEESVLINGNKFGGSVILGMVVLVSGAICWSFGSLYMRNAKTGVPLFYLAGMQAFAGGIFLLIISLISGELFSVDTVHFSFLSILSIIYLIIFGSFIAYTSYVWLLKVSTPAKVSTYAYFNPLVAILLGSLIADEVLTVHMYIGSAAILISILLINKPWKQLKLLK